MTILHSGEGTHLTRLQPGVLERIAWSSELACLVRYLDIHTYEIGLAAHLLANTPPFPHLKYICVSESSYPPKPLKYLPPYQSNSVTCLRYTSGSLHDLGLLMSMLPHLTTLHAGGWPYATHIDIPEEIKIVCKLRKVRFHLALRYKAKYLGWLLGSSVDSMEELSIKRAAHLLEEGIQYFEGVKRMSLFLPNCANKGTGDTDYYNLKSTLIRFTRLEQVGTCLRG